MRNKRFTIPLLLAAAAFMMTACQRADGSLPENPVIFQNETFINPADQNDTYFSVTYQDRIYIPYGKPAEGGVDADAIGSCLGYQMQDGVEDQNMRFYALAGDEDTVFLMRKYVGGIMDQPVFFRAVDTKAKNITVPAYVEPDHDGLFWTDLSAADPARLDELRAQYPEYFELSSFKGIEIYVWETAAERYECGLMSGTNRNKTDSEIASLKPLTIDDAKLILDSLGVPEADRIVIPVVQKNSGYVYETVDAYREKVQKLFDE